MLIATMEWIGPPEAREMLALNTGNFRKPDKHRVALYAKEMELGRWELNGDTIKIGDGVLLDGQHRLLAVIKSGKRVQMLVVRNIASDGHTVDRGKPRTISQWCSHVGISNGNLVAAAAKLILFYEKGLWARPSVQSTDVLDSEQLDFIEQNSEPLLLCVRQTRRTKHIISSALMSTILYVGCDGRAPQEVDVATWFCDALVDGNGLTENDAVLHLRNRVMLQTPQKRIDRFVLRALCTIAWNKTVKGEPCTAAAFRLRLAGPGVQNAPGKIEKASEWQ